jgi:hypothetical protein
LRAVHTRLMTLASATRIKEKFEGNVAECTADFSQALEALERLLARLEITKVETPERPRHSFAEPITVQRAPGNDSIR